MKKQDSFRWFKVRSHTMTFACRLCILLMVGTLQYACQQEYNLYEGDEYVQFGSEKKLIYKKSFELADTVKSYTFVYENSAVTQDTVYFDLYALGGHKDYDRPFSLSQEVVPGVANAEPGIHFFNFDDPAVSGLYTFKAGTVHYSVPIILKRDVSLQSGTYLLKIKLLSNDNFKQGESELLWRKIYFSDQLIKPNRWLASMEKSYFGKYSKVKHRFMIDKTGQRWDDSFLITIMADFGLFKYWLGKAKQEIAKYNNANPNNPLRDENGELVIIP